MKLKMLALACAAIAVTAGTAYAQCPDQLCLPNGTPVKCSVDSTGTKVWVDLAGNPISTQTGGTGDFKVVQCDCPNQTLYLEPTDLQISSSDPSFGTVKTRIDHSRVPRQATLVVNADGSYTEDFYFYVVADAPGLPNLTGVQELHFQSRTVRTFNPHVNEPFNQVEPVDFVDAAGNVVLTLNSTQIVLNQ